METALMLLTPVLMPFIIIIAINTFPQADS